MVEVEGVVVVVVVAFLVVVLVVSFLVAAGIVEVVTEIQMRFSSSLVHDIEILFNIKIFIIIFK